jgi:hypothetical protein
VVGGHKAAFAAQAVNGGNTRDPGQPRGNGSIDTRGAEVGVNHVDPLCSDHATHLKNADGVKFAPHPHLGNGKLFVPDLLSEPLASKGDELHPLTRLALSPGKNHHALDRAINCFAGTTNLKNG